jgi:hypothetical protein
MGEGEGVPRQRPLWLPAWFQKRRSWLVLGRTLGGFGAFLAGIVAAVQFVQGDEGRPPVAPKLAALSSGVTTPPPTPTSLKPSYEYTEVTDRERRIRVEVPTAWGNVLGNGWHARGLPPFPEEELIGPGLNASPNVAAWSGDFETPGVFIGVSRRVLQTYTPRQLASEITYARCTFDRREPYTNHAFTGEVVHWRCPGSTRWIVLAATPTGARDYVLWIQTKLVDERDVEAYNRILSTFEVSLE